MNDRYSIGRVFSGGLEAITRAFPVQIALLVLFAVIPTGLSFLVLIPMLGGLGAVAAGNAGLAGAGFGTAALIYLVIFVFASAQYPAMIRAGVEALEGRRPEIGECIRHGLRKAVPFFILLVLTTIGLTVGFVLLFVPGVILAVRWSASMGALAAEPIGPISAFSRSAELTRGSRWRVFGLAVAAFIGLFIFEIGLVFVLGLGSFAATGAGSAAAAPGGGGLIASVLLGLALGLYIIGLIASHYVECRRVREGARPEQLAEVFA